MSDNPVAKISRTAWMNADETLTVMMALCGGTDDKGDEARFVGGCVRDAVLNIKAYDVDIACVFEPQEVTRRLKSAGIKAVPTGIDHGTVTAVVNDATFEITTLRHDIKTDGRHAVVRFTEEWREDARRRDFTMNALYCNVRGEVYDYFNGLEDAHKGIVRFIDDADKRIQEDYLRILRYYRFSAHYADLKKMDLGARQACAKYAEKLNGISAERIQIETLKLLNARQADKLWGLMLDDGVVDVILPQAKNIHALQNMIALEAGLESPAYNIRRLAALIGFDINAARQVAEGLKLSNDNRDMLIILCDRDAKISAGVSETELRKAVYFSDIDIVRSRILMDAAADNKNAEDIRPAYEFVTRIRLPEFPIRGQDLIDRNVKKGAGLGRILKEVESWWIEQDFKPGRSESLKKLEALIA